MEHHPQVPPPRYPPHPNTEINIVYVLHLTWSSGQEKLTLFQSQEMLTVLQGYLMNHKIPPPTMLRSTFALDRLGWGGPYYPRSFGQR